jgi:hypothetical protein
VALPLIRIEGLEAFRDRPAPAADRDEKPSPVADEGGRQVLACARCHRPITSATARIAVGGAHEHTFVNPHGLEFRIGCFALVTGCIASGEPTTFWSWFPGYAWQIEHCASCLEHLGWEFGSADHRFHGLVLDRLVALDERP